MATNEIDWLQRWYADHCNGDWEHSSGIEIRTIDNPGWRITVNLSGTELEGREFQEIRSGEEGADWFMCWVTDNCFQGACSPENLVEVIGTFRSWSEG